MTIEDRQWHYKQGYKDGREDAIDDVKQFLYTHKDVGYTELLEFLDNLEEQK